MLAAAVLAALGTGCGEERLQPGEETPKPPEPAAAHAGSAPASPDASAFADPASCGGCHPAELDAWAGSQHDRAMEVASPETVLGDFSDATFDDGRVVTRFRRSGERGERFLVETEGPTGERGEYEVSYTFGVHPLQQYLVAMPGGKLQTLRAAWDVEARRWFSPYEEEALAPDDPLHWTGRLLRWNVMCADCHSTALATRYDVETDRYETERVALDVSCQACHGPGAAHVARAREWPKGAPLPEGADTGLVGGLAEGTAKGEIESCAPCHSHRRPVSERAVPGEPLLDHWAPSLLREDLYHADGQIDAEVYVYGSFVQSLMHRRGVRCSDCHEPHGLGLRAEGNALCTRCHSAEPDPRFPTLPARRYDDPEHHFHRPGSEGAACVSCHMPARRYMGIDARRDHGLRRPRPDLSVTIGVPDPCTGCHGDRDPGWAASVLAERRGGAPPAPHWGESLAAARTGAPESAARLRALAGDAGAPGIARATALVELARVAPTETAGPALAAAEDADGLIRLASATALESVPPGQAVPALLRLAGDRRRAVRIEAARVLAFLPADALAAAPAEERAAFEAALDEYRALLRAEADQPSAHLSLGALDARRGRPGRAEAAYRTALRLDPEFLPASSNLAMLLNAQGRNDEARIALEQGVASALRRRERSPDDPGVASELGHMHYSLGLLLAEMERTEEAERELAQAASLLPDLPRVQYNHGLSLQRLDRRREAQVALERAERLAPDDPVFQHALAVLHAQAGARDAALVHARRVVELTGGAPGTRELVRQIESLPASPGP